ncbi:MAG: hypothetical protein ACYS9T_06525, partial [Planctomycetota bacterium]
MTWKGVFLDSYFEGIGTNRREYGKEDAMVYKTVIWTLLHSCIISVFGCQDVARKPTVEATQQAGAAMEQQSTGQTLYV